MNAEAIPQQSFLSWMLESLGVYGLILPVLGLILFAGGLVVVSVSRRPSVVAACLAFVPLPLMIGAFAFLHSAITTLSAIAHSPVPPTPKNLAAGVSTGLFAPLAAVIVTIPGLLVLACGLLMRTARGERGPAE